MEAFWGGGRISLFSPYLFATVQERLLLGWRSFFPQFGGCVAPFWAQNLLLCLVVGVGGGLFFIWRIVFSWLFFTFGPFVYGILFPVSLTAVCSAWLFEVLPIRLIYGG